MTGTALHPAPTTPADFYKAAWAFFSGQLDPKAPPASTAQDAAERRRRLTRMFAATLALGVWIPGGAIDTDGSADEEATTTTK